MWPYIRDDNRFVVGAALGAISGAATVLAVEKYKSRLKNASRYHQSQFALYQSLWSSLYDLKLAADRLWKTANIVNLRGFADQLQKTKEMVERNKLLIEEDHEKELRSLIKAFWDVDFGKRRLISLREESDDYDDIRSRMIEHAVRQNGKVKERYNELVEALASSFRKQLKTP